MTNESPRNQPASVRQRLLNLARQRGKDFNFLLTLYGLERLLYRLGRSPHRTDFVLKGAMLLRAWSVSAHRPTRDLDLLGRGEPSRKRLESVFASLWDARAEEDGLELEPGTIRSQEIRENQEYGGVRVTMVARLGNARIPIQVDVGFGDAVTPARRQSSKSGIPRSWTAPHPCCWPILPKPLSRRSSRRWSLWGRPTRG
jgi:hypothetical protein